MFNKDYFSFFFLLFFLSLFLSQLYVTFWYFKTLIAIPPQWKHINTKDKKNSTSNPKEGIEHISLWIKTWKVKDWLCLHSGPSVLSTVSPFFVLLPPSSLLLWCSLHPIPTRQVTVPELTAETATLLYLHKFGKYLLSAWCLLILPMNTYWVPTTCQVPPGRAERERARDRHGDKGRKTEGERRREAEKTAFRAWDCGTQKNKNQKPVLKRNYSLTQGRWSIEWLPHRVWCVSWWIQKEVGWRTAEEGCKIAFF